MYDTKDVQISFEVKGILLLTETYIDNYRYIHYHRMGSQKCQC